ncbi:hypothetical protein Tco_0071770 [Tanacetum coccineum]
MHEDFIAMVYPKVHESLKHTTEEHVFLENPPSSSGTLLSMNNLDDAFTYGDQFLYDKPTEEEPCKANVETKVESMVIVPIHLASSIVPHLSTPVIDLTQPKLIDKYINENVKEAVQNALKAPIHERFKELSEFEIKEILRDRMFESGSYRSQPEHIALYDALEASMDRENREEFMDATAKSRKRRSQTSSAWKISDIREAPSSSSQHKAAPQSEQPVDDVPILDDVHISDSEDAGIAHLLKIKTRPDWLMLVLEEERPETPESDLVIPLNDLPEPENNWANAIAKSYKDPEENKLLRKVRDMASFIKWYCRQIRKSKRSKADLEGPSFKVVRPFHGNNISLQFQMEECHLLLTDQIDLVNPEGKRVVSDVSKPLPLGGPPDFGLEELVPSLWIKSEREYDINAAYGISYWWFKRKEFYITRHSAPSNRHAARSHMKILSVVSLKTFSRYSYTFLRKIVLRRANYKEYKISKADFKNLHPNDFEDLNIVIRKCMEDLQLGIESYQTKLNLTEPSWNATDFLFKEDYTIFSKPRAIIYRDRNNQKKMMRESEVHKFSDGTLTRILEKLDHMVKDFMLFKFNRGMEHIIWSEDDKKRSKEFI